MRGWWRRYRARHARRELAWWAYTLERRNRQGVVLVSLDALPPEGEWGRPLHCMYERRDDGLIDLYFHELGTLALAGVREQLAAKAHRALAAASGPWEWHHGYPQEVVSPNAVLVASVYEDPDVRSVLAEYIASASPDVLLNLLRELGVEGA